MCPASKNFLVITGRPGGPIPEPVGIPVVAVAAVSRRAMLRRWRVGGAAIIGLVVAGWARWVSAQDGKAVLLSAYVPPSELAQSDTAAAINRSLLRLDSNERWFTAAPRQLSEGQRWEKFEAEFGIRQKDPSLVGGSL